MSKIFRYENGLKAAVNYIPSFRSVAIGFWAGVGSSKETPDINGLSHFTEHTMFKGTSTLSALDIASKLENMGTVSNAFTGKELTCYHINALSEFAEESFSLVSELLTDSTFPKEELDKERKVIVEEINMGEDDPEDICYDLLGEASYGGAKLGQTILGPIDNVNRFDGDDIRRFMKRFYTADNMAITIAGGVTPETADKYIRKYLLDKLPAKGCGEQYEPKLCITSDFRERIKDFEQSNVGIAYRGVAVDDEAFMRQAYLSIILGGGMASRLFQRIREQSGLAYSVYSAPATYRHNGMLDVFVNVTPANVKRVVSEVRAEVELLREKGITDEEFDRAKIQLKTSAVFGFENPKSIMLSLARPLLMLDLDYDLDVKLAEIEAVTKEQVNDFARTFLSKDGVCAAYVGKKTDADIMQILTN